MTNRDQPAAYRRVSKITGAVTGFFEHDNVECRSERLESLYLHPAHTEEEVQQIIGRSSSEIPGSFEATVRRILGVPAP